MCDIASDLFYEYIRTNLVNLDVVSSGANPIKLYNASKWINCIRIVKNLFLAVCNDSNNLSKINDICDQAKNECSSCNIEDIFYYLKHFVRYIADYDEYVIQIFEDRFLCLINSTSRNENAQNDCVFDIDNDFVPDSTDNCVVTYNPLQQDWNNNGTGDACEDFDRDGIIDFYDNCVSLQNPNQEDKDNDNIGDACDNCPKIYNPNQDPKVCEYEDIIDSLTQAGCEPVLDSINYIFSCMMTVNHSDPSYPTYSGPASYDAVIDWHFWMVDNWNCRISVAFDQFSSENACAYWKDNPFPLPVALPIGWSYTNYFNFYDHCTGDEIYTNDNTPDIMNDTMVQECDCEFMYAEAISDLTYYESLIECIPVNIPMGNPECSNIKPGDIFGGLLDRYNEAINRLVEVEAICGF